MPLVTFDRQQVFMVFIIMMIFFNVQSTRDEAGETRERAVLQTYKDLLEASKQQLFLSSYDTGYGNLTGLKLSYDDSVAHRNILRWPFRQYGPDHPWRERQQDLLLPDSVSDRVRLFWGTAEAVEGEKAYLLNISGAAYGEFDVVPHATPLQPVPMPLPRYLREYYNYYRHEKYEEEKERYEDDPESNAPPQEYLDSPQKVGNITAYTHGAVDVRIQSLAEVYPDLNVAQLGLGVHDGASVVRLTVTLKDRPEIDVNQFDMFAVYFERTGALVGVTKSAKFMGNHALPHFAMADANFARAKVLMSRLLNITDIQADIMLDDVTASVQQAQLLCELVSYVQLLRTDYTRDELLAIDTELTRPQGLPLPKTIPRIEVAQALMYLPDCGLVFEKTPAVELSGKRTEVLVSQLRHVLLGVMVLVMLEINLFVRLTKQCQTPSHLSNISTFGLGLFGSFDLLMCTSVLFFMRFSELFLLCSGTFILYSLLAFFLQVRFLMTIEATQANERATTWWEILRGARDSDLGESQDLEAQTDGTAAQVADTAPPQQAQLTEESGNLVGYFVQSLFVAFILMYLVFSAMTWRVSARGVFEYVFLLGINSFWIPQFLRNTLKNRRRTLPWEFVFGASLVRLIPVVYICLNPGNPFRHAYDPKLVLTLTAWFLAQILLLYLQSVLGARFWVNDRWLPEQHNYHPLLTLKELETGFASDVIASLQPVPGDEHSSMCEIDCAICTFKLTFPIVGSEDAKDKRAYEKQMKTVMVTPCHHIFHSTCLEDWMTYKLQCPICRSALPPL